MARIIEDQQRARTVLRHEKVGNAVRYLQLRTESLGIDIDYFCLHLEIKRVSPDAC